MLEFQATHTLTDRELTVRLELRNGAKETVYVPILPVDAEFVTYPNSAYVHLTNDETAVCLILGPSLLPTDCDVEVQMSAYYTKLAPGSRLQHTLKFALPCQEWYAYLVPPPEEEAEPVLAYQIKIFVEAVWKSQVKHERPAQDHESLFEITPKQTEMLHQILTPDEPVPVLKAGDEGFPRL
jgi:hypothetical protein